MFLDYDRKREHQISEVNLPLHSVRAAGSNLGVPVFSEDGEKPPSPLEGRHCECIGLIHARQTVLNELYLPSPRKISLKVPK